MASTAARDKVYVPGPLRIAHFVEFYGDARYRNSMWPTRDKIIPWKRFLLEYRMMWQVMAKNRLSLTRAFERVMMADMGAAQRRAKEEIEEAYP